MSTKKKVTGYIKLQLPAGKANPSPPVGPALGQHGVNIMGFCKDFNARKCTVWRHDYSCRHHCLRRSFVLLYNEIAAGEHSSQEGCWSAYDG